MEFIYINILNIFIDLQKFTNTKIYHVLWGILHD